MPRQLTLQRGHGEGHLAVGHGHFAGAAGTRNPDTTACMRRATCMLLKNIIKFANSEEEDEKIIETQYQRMLGQLAGIEFNMTKSRLVANMNMREETNYAELETKISEGIEEARREIEETKLELEEAKQIRKNRLEYDQLGKVILEHPDRPNSLARIESIKEDEITLRNKEKMLEEKLGQRKKQFHLLISTIHQLQTLIGEEDGINFNSDEEEAEGEEQQDQEVIVLDASQE